MSREAVFIDFHWFSFISGGFEAIRGQKVGQPVAGCGGLWRPVAGCGGIILPLQDDAIRQSAFCSIGRLQIAEWEIARYCSNG